MGSDEDPFDPHHTLCSQNNAAALSVAACSSDKPTIFRIIGSDDVDGLIVTGDQADRIRISDLPVTALPWRDGEMFVKAGRSDRPLFGSDDASSDIALGQTATIDGADAIAALTDVLGADHLELAGGLVTIEGRRRLTLPRLRIAQAATLPVNVTYIGRGRVNVLHLSGGRRVGGGSATVAVD